MVRTLTNLASKSFTAARKGLGILIVLAVCSGAAYAHGGSSHGANDCPEIDPGSMASAVTLLAGGVLMLTDKVRLRRN